MLEFSVSTPLKLLPSSIMANSSVCRAYPPSPCISVAASGDWSSALWSRPSSKEDSRSRQAVLSARSCASAAHGADEAPGVAAEPDLPLSSFACWSPSGGGRALGPVGCKFAFGRGLAGAREAPSEA
eukprot:scaffold47_cov258-Pinguiococcus_pyrenoidosus.AAC.24